MVAQSFELRLEDVFKRTLPKLAPDMRAQLAEIITPYSLKIIAGVLAFWAAGNLLGYGEIIDIVIGAVGVFSIGMSVFSGIDELFQFARETYSAQTDTNLDDASNHLAKAIAILGIQAVLALLFKGRPRGGRGTVRAEPPKTTGLRYKPITVGDPTRAAGSGITTFWGDVSVSTNGTSDDRALALLHEQVHQFLAPKFYILRKFRVENRAFSYTKSSLFRYIEEALAETIAQVGRWGFSKVFVGLKFPVKYGYVYIMKAGGYNRGMRGGGLLPEGAGLIASGFIQTMAFELWFKSDINPPVSGRTQGSAFHQGLRVR